MLIVFIKVSDISDSCNTELSSKTSLINHIKAVHEGITYNCNVCQLRFSQQSNLKTHIRSQHTSIRYPCKICDNQAKRQSHLTTHIQNIHKDNVICPECNKSLKQYSLTNHKKRFHSSEIPFYNCSICSYQTTDNRSLKNHIKMAHLKIHIY